MFLELKFLQGDREDELGQGGGRFGVFPILGQGEGSVFEVRNSGKRGGGIL